MTPQALAALHHALSEVYSGADIKDAEAVADQLGDIGFEVIAKPGCDTRLPLSWRNPRGS